MILLIVISASVSLLRRQNGQDQKVPVRGMEIPYSLFYFLLSSALLFSWFQFGYLFHSIINERVNLFALLQTSGERLPEPPETIEGSLYSMLNDGGFVDLYFRSNLKDYITGLPADLHSRALATIVGGFVYGGLFGALHGLMLV